MLRFLWILFLTLSLSVQAVVYTLRPGTTAKSVAEALAAEEILSRPIQVNGKTGQLTVSSTTADWGELVQRLKPFLETTPVAGPATLLLEGEEQDGWRTRYLIVQTDPNLQIVIFRLRLPSQAFDAGAPPWPTELPEPRGSEIETVMILGESTIYATFSSPAFATAIARDYDSRLRRDGWSRLDDKPNGGAVYQNSDQSKMVIFSVIQQQGRTHAAVYLTRNGGELD